MENKKYYPQELLFDKIEKCLNSNGLKTKNEYIIENKKGWFQIFKNSIFDKSKNVTVFMHTINKPENLKSFDFDDTFSKKIRNLIEYYEYLENKEQIDTENVKIINYLKEL